MKPMSIGLKLSAAAHCALFAVFSMFLAPHPGFHSGWRLGAFAGAVGLTLLSILFARKFKGSASRPLAIHPVATRNFNGSASRPPVIHPVAIGSIITFGISVLLYCSVWGFFSSLSGSGGGADTIGVFDFVFYIPLCLIGLAGLILNFCGLIMTACAFVKCRSDQFASLAICCFLHAIPFISILFLFGVLALD